MVRQPIPTNSPRHATRGHAPSIHHRPTAPNNTFSTTMSDHLLSHSSGSRCRIILLLLLSLLNRITTISAFAPPSSSISSISTRTRQLSAVPSPQRMFDYKKKPPTFNKQTALWEPSPETEEPPYGPWGSFLRGGPTPFLVRVLKPTEYDQAVFKYMAQTSCSRAEAQGNMDAFFNNAAGKCDESGHHIFSITYIRNFHGELIRLHRKYSIGKYNLISLRFFMNRLGLPKVRGGKGAT
jgi:hypothetical protein